MNTDKNQIQASGRLALLELTPELQLPAAAAAAADRHQLIAPTHVVVKDGRVIGYGSLGRVRLFFAWMDTKHATPRDSFAAWRLAEAEMADGAAAQHRPTENLICMPCEAGSPFAPYLKHKGYDILGTAQITLKNLKG